MLKYDVGTVSIKGSKPTAYKSENQDKVLDRRISFPLPNLEKDVRFVAVADGAGGMPPGGYAARYLMDDHLSVDPIFDPNNPDNIENQVAFYLKGLHRKFTLEHEDASEEWLKKSASTLSLAVLYDDSATLYWVGDSPMFLTKFAKRTPRSRKLIPQTTWISEEGQHGLEDAFGGETNFNLYQMQINFNIGDILTIATDGALKGMDYTLLDKIYEKSECMRDAIELLKTKHMKFPSDDASVIVVKKLS